MTFNISIILKLLSENLKKHCCNYNYNSIKNFYLSVSTKITQHVILAALLVMKILNLVLMKFCIFSMRQRAEIITFLCCKMDKHYALGMILTLCCSLVFSIDKTNFLWSRVMIYEVWCIRNLQQDSVADAVSSFKAIILGYCAVINRNVSRAYFEHLLHVVQYTMPFLNFFKQFHNLADD